MPTPFYHLGIADALLETASLEPAARRFLETYRSAFYFGHTAPDVQSVSGQRRQETHHFRVPVQAADRPAWERLLQRYPALATPEALPPAQAAFLAGYLCHLQADWMWVLQIYQPVFGPDCGWETRRRRSYLHNVLRIYLDRQALPGLRPDIRMVLEGARPINWLPFVQDSQLDCWRDYLSRQLQPGAAVQTVAVFAARQGIPAEDYDRLLASEARLDREVFTWLPRRSVEAYRRELLRANIDLLNGYLRSCNG